MLNQYKPKWTFIFILISIIGFILQQLLPENFWIIFTFIPAYSSEFPWMFLTSIFLHADVSHLFFNMFSLFLFGIYLEKMIGPKLFILIFLLAGFFGNFGFLISTTNPFIPGLGASGAVYGVLGALAVLTPFLTIYIYGLIPMPIIVAAIIYALLDVFGLFAPGTVAHGAHLAGMFIGIVFGLYLKKKKTLLL